MKITLDPRAGVAMTGYTLSFDFPVTQNAYQSTFGGMANAFICDAGSDASGHQGAGLTYSSLLRRHAAAKSLTT